MKKAGPVIVWPVVIAIGVVHQSFGQIPAKRFITSDGKPPGGLYAPGVMVGKTLYISGKGDYRPAEEFPEKVKNCLNEVRKTLRMADLDMEHVVKSYCYLEDPEKYKEFNKCYAEFFPTDPPARTTLALECSTPSIALDIHLEDCRVMDEAIDRGQRHSLIWKDFSPFAKWLIGGDQH